VQSFFSKQSNVTVVISLSLIFLAIVARIFHVADNFSPIGAIALFAGTMLAGNSRWFIPFAGLALSDVILALTNTYGLSVYQYLTGSPAVYLAFLPIILYGFMNKSKNPLVTLATIPAASLTFFIISNFVTWINPIPAWPSMYAMTWDGLMQSYVAAIPFFKNTIMSDTVYSAVLFGAYYLSLVGVKKLTKAQL
jgi:hypothetical protein